MWTTSSLQCETFFLNPELLLRRITLGMVRRAKPARPLRSLGIWVSTINAPAARRKAANKFAIADAEVENLAGPASCRAHR
jgi:hypothetical protein